MSEQLFLPVLSVFGPLFVATIAAYMMLNRSDPHKGR